MRWSVCFLVLVLPICGHAASFNCEKAGSPREKLICFDETLSQMDSDLGRFYRLAAASVINKPGLHADQRQWLTSSESQCPVTEGGDAKEEMQCLRQRYAERLSALIDLLRAAMLRKAPEIRVGPYLFKQPRIPLDPARENNHISYTLLIGQPQDVADSFNAITSPPSTAFRFGCAEQTVDSTVSLATDKIVNLQGSSWLYCEGASHGYGGEGTQTIVMQPKPHLMRPEDLFRPGTNWQERLGDACVESAEDDLTDEQERRMRELAGHPDTWAATPEALIVYFGDLLGYPNGLVEVHVPWSQLDGFLVSNPPFQ